LIPTLCLFFLDVNLEHQSISSKKDEGKAGSVTASAGLVNPTLQSLCKHSCVLRLDPISQAQFQWIGLRENLQESPMILMGKSMVSCRFSQQNQSIDNCKVSITSSSSHHGPLSVGSN
jgi:hypothetical protein